VDVREHLSFLHDATQQIGSGPDAGTALARLCDAAVPRLADGAVAYVRAEPGALCRMAEADRGEPVELPVEVSPHELTGPYEQALREGRPAMAPDPPTLVAPLLYGGRVEGFVALNRAAERGTFDDVDLLTTALMTDQAARGIHAALLFRSEANIAAALQRSMLPESPPTLPGVEIAHRYLPSNPSAQVGGDWYDAVPLSGGRVALIIGDVMGHGIASAAAMGQLRTAARTLATLDLPPEQSLRHLDDMARELGGSHLATCVLCVYDPVTRRCTIANAGHIPPVLQHPDGRTEFLDLPTGGPIGLGGVAYSSVEFHAPDGGVIVFCTDGLIESRTRHLDEGLNALSDALPFPPPPLDSLCDKVLATLHSADRQDDIALLIARFRGIPAGDVARWILRPDLRTAGRARWLTRATLAGWAEEGFIDTAELLVSELVTNAVRYASRPIELRLMRTGSLLCEVTDDDLHLPVPRDPEDDDEGGRGLYLVNRLAHRWGASRTTTGKAVWFELTRCC